MIHVFTVLTCHLLAENGIARHKKVTLSVKKMSLHTFKHDTLPLSGQPIRDGVAVVSSLATLCCGW